MQPFRFVTKPMIPASHDLTPQQEEAFLLASSQAHGVAPGALVRMIAVELPDTHTAWEYHAAYTEASKSRDDLVPPAITSKEQWDGRPNELARVVACLWAREAPAVSFISFAVLKQKNGGT